MGYSGYSYFGRPRGLQEISGGVFSKFKNVNEYVELEPSKLEVDEGIELVRISKYKPTVDSLLQIVSIYIHAKEKRADRGGGFAGACIALFNCKAEAEHILSCLLEMLGYVRSFLDEDNRFNRHLDQEELKIPKPLSYNYLEKSLETINIGNTNINNLSGFVKLNDANWYNDVLAFIHEGLEYHDHFNDLYACTTTSFIKNKSEFRIAELDLNYVSRMKDIKSQYQSLIVDVDNEKGKIKKLDGQINSLLDELRNKEDEKAKMTGLMERKRKAYTDEINELEGKIQVLKGDKQNLQEIYGNSKDLKHSIDKLKEQKEQLDAVINEKQRKKAEIENTITALTKDKNNREAELDTIKKQLENILVKEDSIQENVKALTRKEKEQNDKLIKLQDKLNILEEKIVAQELNYKIKESEFNNSDSERKKYVSNPEKKSIFKSINLSLIAFAPFLSKNLRLFAFAVTLLILAWIIVLIVIEVKSQDKGTEINESVNGAIGKNNGEQSSLNYSSFDELTTTNKFIQPIEDQFNYNKIQDSLIQKKISEINNYLNLISETNIHDHDKMSEYIKWMKSENHNIISSKYNKLYSDINSAYHDWGKLGFPGYKLREVSVNTIPNETLTQFLKRLKSKCPKMVVIGSKDYENIMIRINEGKIFKGGETVKGVTKSKGELVGTPEKLKCIVLLECIEKNSSIWLEYNRIKYEKYINN